MVAVKLPQNKKTLLIPLRQKPPLSTTSLGMMVFIIATIRICVQLVSAHYGPQQHCPQLDIEKLSKNEGWDEEEDQGDGGNEPCTRTPRRWSAAPTLCTANSLIRLHLLPFQAL